MENSKYMGHKILITFLSNRKKQQDVADGLSDEVLNELAVNHISAVEGRNLIRQLLLNYDPIF
jgi:hypothetical protein